MSPADLKKARQQLGLTRAELAAALLVKPRIIYTWESGGTKRIPGPVQIAIGFMLKAGKSALTNS